jgi:hypothetical protein
MVPMKQVVVPRRPKKSFAARVLGWLFPPDRRLTPVAGWQPVESILIKDAVVCLDCRRVTAHPKEGNQCAGCGSAAVLKLANILGEP